MSALEAKSRRLKAGENNCDEIILWSRMGAGDEARRDYIEGICEEDQLDRGG
jgi:hypothetical protein